jgi:iron complex transport system substrate-binding protein
MPPRVVTLLPSATEIVSALGVDPVAVSHECDHSPGVEALPAVTASRVDPEGATGAEVDAQVTEAVEEGGVYAIDREALAAADPDIVVTQGICDVCAVDHALVREAVADLGLDAEVIPTHPHTLADVFADVKTLGSVLGREERAADLLADLRTRVAAVEERTPPPAEGPRVAVLDWLDPVMVGGHWVPGLVERAGGRYGLADRGERSTPREWAAIREYDPEVLLAAPCGFDLDHTRATLDDLLDRPGFGDLAAARAGEVYAMDGHHYVNRPGPRLVDTLECFAACLHPDRLGGTGADPGCPLEAVTRVSGAQV